MDKRVLRSYRGMSPARFYSLNRRVRRGLARLWDTVLAANATLKSEYESASDQHEEAYHEALLGSIVEKARRDQLQAQITEYLDEIAVILESAAFYNPEVLLVSGFDLAKERRGRPRTKPAPTHVSQAEQDGAAPGGPPSA